MRAKTALFEQFAIAGKGVARPARLDLLDLLAQGEWPVEPLASAAGLKLSTASAHLQILKAFGPVRTRRDGLQVVYRSPDRKYLDQAPTQGLVARTIPPCRRSPRGQDPPWSVQRGRSPHR